MLVTISTSAVTAFKKSRDYDPYQKNINKKDKRFGRITEIERN